MIASRFPGSVMFVAGPEAFAQAFDVSRETIERLKSYENLLCRWQKAVNLVAAKTLTEVWHRHFADSAQVVRLAPKARTWVDLGSGAGFPGLVVAVLLAERADSRVVLIESDRRKAAFLREAARHMAIPVDIWLTRVENLKTQPTVPTVDVVTARAVAPLPRLLKLAAPLLRPDTLGIFLKGRTVAAEVRAAQQMWSFEIELVPSLTEKDAFVAVIGHVVAKRERSSS